MKGSGTEKRGEDTKILKRGASSPPPSLEKRGEDTKILKRWASSQGVGDLKRGAGTPLQTMSAWILLRKGMSLHVDTGNDITALDLVTALKHGMGYIMPKPLL